MVVEEGEIFQDPMSPVNPMIPKAPEQDVSYFELIWGCGLRSVVYTITQGSSYMHCDFISTVQIFHFYVRFGWGKSEGGCYS